MDKARDCISKYLYFNGSIRFIMEGFLDFVLFSLLNVESADWSGDFFVVTFNNWSAILILVIFILLPIFWMIMYV